MGKVVLFGGKKGGVGKSTLTTNMAALRLAKAPEKKLLLLDTDSQGSTANWATDRKESTDDIIDCLKVYGSDILDKIDSALEEYDNIIIDSGGRDTSELRYSMLMADVMVVPVKAGLMDLDTLYVVDELVSRAKEKGNPDLKCFAVINEYKNHPHITRDQGAINHIRQFDHLVPVESVIHDRISFQRASEKGLGVNELRNDRGRLADSKAISEITKLYEVIYNE